MTCYYNEIDPYAAQWLRNLIEEKLIADGDVDERSIEDVRPNDLRGYTQCHFFAGIGVWSHALRNAGWSDDRPVWTGSCPCQPFSSAGKGNGTADERHLWPAWYHLIRQCKPDVIFGEQVEAAIRHSWLDLVQTDLEGSGYTLGAVGLPAAGFGAPHIRQRLFFVADAVDIRQFKQWDSTTAALQGYGTERSGEYEESRLSGFVSRGSQGLGCTGELAHHHQGLEGRREPGCECSAERALGAGCVVGGLADSCCERRDRLDTCVCRRGSQQTGIEDDGHCKTVQHGRFLSARELANIPYEGRYVDPSRDPGPTNGQWRDADWLFCRDGRWRPVEPGTFPLAHGASARVGRGGSGEEPHPEIPRKDQGNRVGRLRAYGNAIVAPVAEEFIRAYMSCNPA